MTSVTNDWPGIEIDTAAIEAAAEAAELAALVVNPKDWQYGVGIHFWWLAGSNANPASADGWVYTSLTMATNGGGFFDAADRGGNAVSFSAASDLLLSPTRFGDYNDMLMAAWFLGANPTKLHCEFLARFTASAANEAQSGFGLVNTSAFLGNTAGHIGFIRSNGANFLLQDDSNSDTGAAVDNNWHVFKITLTAGGSLEWFIDGVSQGTIAMPTNDFPCGFGQGVMAAGVNFNELSWVHIWYEV